VIRWKRLVLHENFVTRRRRFVKGKLPEMTNVTAFSQPASDNRQQQTQQWQNVVFKIVQEHNGLYDLQEASYEQ